ncbi:MAG: nucleoside hydrolase [Bacteroidales bacterium]|nr:nucleoside hydrolase [Bacteroidales bacterium]
MKRIAFILLFLTCTVHAGNIPDKTYTPQPRMRVIIDNDFSGDPDGLFQLVHHMLSPSVDIRGIIGSHLTAHAGFDNSGNSAEKACRKAETVLKTMGIRPVFPIIEGAPGPMTDIGSPIESDGAALIIKEALRTDTDMPLYVVCGAGLTNVASAFLLCPEIQDRFTLIWIGGQEYDALPPPGHSIPEYNLNLCIPAAQVVFNQSKISIWQVPRNAYRQCIYSVSELMTDIYPCGKTGEMLAGEILGLMAELKQYGNRMGEVYIMGDNPLVLLTALQTGFEPDPASSHYQMRQAPFITSEGTYRHRPDGRWIRVYDLLDNRLMFKDLVSKLKLFTEPKR